jgi:urease accessory protein
MIHQLPEKVLHVRVTEENNPTLLVQVGHIIGNRHRPISISDDGAIVFPIHNDGELDLFKELFHDIVDHLELRISEEIFTSNKGMNSHEH